VQHLPHSHISTLSPCIPTLLENFNTCKKTLSRNFLAAYRSLLTLPAYRTEAELLPSRMAMFVAVLFANMHDLLFDMGCSSRISCAGYAVSTGAFDYDLPQAFVVGFIDVMAMKTLEGLPDKKPTYGDNALFATCVWDIFNVRYAAWERFIKYTRLLRRSDSDIAARILKSAEDNLILPYEGAGIREAWEDALNPASALKLQTRNNYTHMYNLEDPAHDLQCHRLNPPELCQQCTAGFMKAFLRKDDQVQAITGLPHDVIYCAPVTLAAAIRRGALWATTLECCDNCACTIGTWANVASDRPVVALMQSEQKVYARDWLLQNYLMGCVAFSPLRLISILAGFDVTADISFEPGAMGERDLVDS